MKAWAIVQDLMTPFLEFELCLFFIKIKERKKGALLANLHEI